jgi:hypothetical protein
LACASAPPAAIVKATSNSIVIGGRFIRSDTQRRKVLRS